MFLLNGLHFNTLKELIDYKMFDNAMTGRAEQFGYTVEFTPYED